MAGRYDVAVTRALTAIATAIVILAISIVPFLTPAWISFEQGRSGAAGLTGYDEATLNRVTGSIVRDLVLGGDFGVTIDGAPVLTDSERGHMRDVRGVFVGFGLLALIGAAILALAARRVSTPEARAAARRAVRDGARALAVAVAALGVLAIVAFDAAFELFHRLFFASGTYTFDPRTSRLVQLFPESFWSDTAIAVGVVAIVVALGVQTFAARSAIA